MRTKISLVFIGLILSLEGMAPKAFRSQTSAAWRPKFEKKETAYSESHGPSSRRAGDASAISPEASGAVNAHPPGVLHRLDCVAC